MYKVLIYKGRKTPTQSGNLKTKYWYLKFKDSINYEEDLMTGWKGNLEPAKKIKIKFSTLERAIAYARNKNYDFEVLDDKKYKINIKSYADNFKFNRNKSDIE